MMEEMAYKADCADNAGAAGLGYKYLHSARCLHFLVSDEIGAGIRLFMRFPFSYSCLRVFHINLEPTK
jgi:hypothetical protein